MRIETRPETAERQIHNISHEYNELIYEKSGLNGPS